MSNITLVFDTSAIATINTKKVMVAVPLLYIFMVFLQLFRLIISSRSSGSSKGPRSPGKGLSLIHISDPRDQRGSRMPSSA